MAGCDTGGGYGAGIGGGNFYGYKVELSNYGAGKIVGSLVKADDTSVTTEIDGDTTISGDATTVIYVVSNAEIDTGKSVLTIE